eukprot:776170_1
MAKTNKETLPLKPTVTTTNRTLDLSSIIDKLDTYPAGKGIYSDEFTLDDLKFSLKFYPQQIEQECEDGNIKTALYIRILNAKQKDHRKIVFSVRYDDRRIHSFVDPVHLFADGQTWGWTKSDITQSALKQNPNIQIHVKLTHDPLVIANTTSQTLETQQQKMHDLSAMHGDVTLMIKLPEFTDDLQSPPKQKRRLNDPYECEVCSKQFASVKALKSHQSNKRDQAHKDYKNKKNDNDNTLDTECNEIKISSVILRSASTMLNRMLSSDMMEKQEQKIEIKAKTLEDVKDMVYYMSTNKLKKTSNALNVIQLAHYYGMDRLFWECASRLLQHVSVQNFVQTIKTFDTFEIANGYDTLVEFAKKNAKELEETDDFNTLSHAFKCVVLNKSC